MRGGWGGLLRSGLNKERVDCRAVGAPRAVVGADFRGGRGFIEAKLLRFGEVTLFSIVALSVGWISLVGGLKTWWWLSIKVRHIPG